MSKSRGKRVGLRARSKNARKTPPAKVTKVLAVMHVRQQMTFYDVAEGAPDEGALVLVRMKNGVYRYGMVLQGRFAAHEYHADEFVTFAHPDWITHWMVIVPPAGTERAASDPPAPTIEEAAMEAGAPDRAEDVYA